MRKNIFFLFFSVFLCLILSEIILRTFYPPRNIEKLPDGLHRADPVMGARMNENFSGIHQQEEFSVTIETNSMGLRDKEYPDKNNSTYRIICLGDSFCFGYGVKSNDTYPKQLEIFLNNSFKNSEFKNKIEVINAGTVGWGTIDEFIFLKLNDDKLKPDMAIVLFFTGNDLWDNLNSLQRKNNNVKKEEFKAVSPNREFLQKNLCLYDFLFKAIMRNSTISYLFYSLGLRRIQRELYEKTDTDLYKKAITATKNALIDMNNYIKSKNSSMLLVILPDDTQVFYDNMLLNKGLNPIKVQSELVDFCRNNKIYVLDLMPYLISNKSVKKLYFKKDNHLNAEGYRYISRITSEFLTQNNILYSYRLSEKP